MKKVRSMVTFFLLAGVMVFSICSNSQAAAEPAKPIKLSFNITVPATGFLATEALQPWIKQVEKATNGRVVFEVYYSASLVKMDMIWDALQKNMVDFADVSFGTYPGLATFTDVLSLPDLIYTNGAHQGGVGWKLFETVPEVANEFKAVKVLLFYSPGIFVIETDTKQVKTREDMKGLKIRSYPGESSYLLTQLAGATPVVMPGAEVYQNITKQVIDGSFANWDQIQSYRLYEVAPYVTLGPFNSSVKAICVSLQTWNKLPKDIQDQIMSVSGLAGSVFWSKAFDANADAARAKAKAAGKPLNEYKLPPAEVNRWVKADGEKVYDWWAKMAADKARKTGIANPDALPKKIHDAALKIVNTYKP